MLKNANENAQNLAEISKERMPGLINKIRFRIKPIDLRACYSSLSHDHLRIGIFDYFVEGNLQSFKQHMHVACKLELAAIALDSYQKFSIGKEIYYALLSDNPKIIDAMASLEPPDFMRNRSNPLNSHFKVHMWQLAILGDYEALQAKVEKLVKHGRKIDRQFATDGGDFFSLLMRRDKNGLENLILRDAVKQTGDPLVEDLIAEMSTYCAKLCWLKGIPVQIDCPLVPMELMPNQPLEHYDDVYDFLQPGWIPPPQGVMAKISHWIHK